MGLGGGGRRVSSRFQSDAKMRMMWTSEGRSHSRIRMSRKGGRVGGDRRLSLPRMSLSAKKDDEADDEVEAAGDKKLQKLMATAKSRLSNVVPGPVAELWDKLLTKFLILFPTLRTIVLSFSLGAVLAIGVIFVPVYNSIDKLTEPVTLFETILNDLDRGYVDDVDTNKLFETGVSAMLRSLDPYTEFEGKSEAVELNESVQGRYGGVGLVISSATPVRQQAAPKQIPAPATSGEGGGNKLLPQEALDDNARPDANDGDITSRTDSPVADSLDDDGDDLDDVDDATMEERMAEKKAVAKARKQGIRVVSAFEGYAYDYGMRVGDRLMAIDGQLLTPTMTAEDVRNKLRGEPGTSVEVTFVRDGVEGENTVSLPRTLVKMRDVKLATFVGDPRDGVGYVQVSGFAAETGRELRNAILALQRVAEDTSGGEAGLRGLVLDLRGNPGGLLTSAVDVASLVVPKGSDIVSARGRGFPSVLYRSRVDPILDPATKLAVLVNGQTASAAEIVSGAIQDLDVGVVVGADRTFGKGLVQNVEDLPFDTALKFTVAKYYTPSGRCIQSTNYKEGGGLNAEDGRYKVSKVKDKDKQVFYTKNGREVKDGGGIEADLKVEVPRASALEVTLLRSGVMTDFAADWSKKHELTNNFDVDEATYREFQAFVAARDKEGDINLDALYKRPLDDLKKSLDQSGFKGSRKELDALRASIIRDIQRDYDTYKKDIKEDIGNSILARYLPESMLIERSIKTDRQVLAAAELVGPKEVKKFNKLLARDIIDNGGVGNGSGGESSSIRTATASVMGGRDGDGAKMKFKW